MGLQAVAETEKLYGYSLLKAWSRRALGGLSQELIVLLVTLVVGVIFSLTLPGFATATNLLTMARSVSVLGMLALGMAIVVIGRGLDLSVVAIMMVSATMALTVMSQGFSVLAGLGVGLLIAIAIGATNGVVIAYIEVPPLFTTLATGLVCVGIAQGIFYICLPSLFVGPPEDAVNFLYIGRGRPYGVPMPVIMFVALALLVHWFLRRTSIGWFIYGQGDNPDAARLTGFDVRRLTTLGYMLSAVIAWIAGVVLSASVASMGLQNLGLGMVFDTILVVVLGGVSLVGGRGGVLSVVAGTLLIGTMSAAKKSLRSKM